MCGFAGFLKLDAAAPEPPPGALQDMSALLRHRGPDAAGQEQFGPCALAHRRLSIIDLTDAGRQPMASEDGTRWLAYNGEVYNFRELRRQFDLDGRGHRFRSRTDTEVILHLFEERGIDCLRELDGMYALALWDGRARTLHLARDPFGIKPLFYVVHAGTLWFASEIKALLAVPGYEPQPSLEALHHFLGFDYVPGPITAFAGIHELRPGWRLEAAPDRREPRQEPFYELTYAVDPAMTEGEAVAGARAALRAAVERQLIADVPVGVMLSGGLDSSALTAMMAEVRGDAAFHTFSLAFAEPSFDESAYARMVAEHLGTRHHVIGVEPGRVAELIPRYLCHIDEPYADGSAIPTFLLAETAREHVTVLLSGEGGDEVFSGYETHAAWRARRWFRRVPRPLRRAIRWGVDRLPVSQRKLSFEFKAKRFVRGAEMDLPTAHYFWRMVLAEDAKRCLLEDPERFAGFPPSAALFVEAYDRCAAEDELNRLLFVDASFHLPDDLMIKNDRMTMAHSIEARVPFTDRRLVDFLARVPPRWKLRGLRPKHLLREAMRGRLPDRVLDKKKVGLEMPYSLWFRGAWRDLGEALLLAPGADAGGLLNPRGIRRLWDEHQCAAADHGRALWGITNYLVWHRLYIERRDWRAHLAAPRPPRHS